MGEQTGRAAFDQKVGLFLCFPRQIPRLRGRNRKQGSKGVGGGGGEEGVALSFAHVNETLNYVYNLQRINCSLLMEVKREVSNGAAIVLQVTTHSHNICDPCRKNTGAVSL